MSRIPAETLLRDKGRCLDTTLLFICPYYLRVLHSTDANTFPCKFFGWAEIQMAKLWFCYVLQAKPLRRPLLSTMTWNTVGNASILGLIQIYYYNISHCENLNFFQLQNSTCPRKSSKEYQCVVSWFWTFHMLFFWPLCGYSTKVYFYFFINFNFTILKKPSDCNFIYFFLFGFSANWCLCITSCQISDSPFFY